MSGAVGEGGVMDFSTAAAVLARYRSGQPLETIARDDLMWRGDRDWYMAIGESALMAILKVLVAGRLNAVRDLLDLPCGHGRVARHLRLAFPDAHMTFCDLNPAAVAFCVRHFEGAGVISKPDLTGLRFDRRFDLIWVGSLLPHLDLERVGAWLTFLCGQLRDDGVLIATFHGGWSIEMHKLFPMIAEDRWAQILKGYDDSGFGYASYEDGMAYPYGINLSRPAVIVDLVSGIGGVRLLLQWHFLN